MEHPTANPSRRVLLVDDHPDSLRGLSRLLRLNGYVVDEASTYREAVAAIEANGCDLLVTDVTLPDGCGFDLLAAIRSRGIDVKGITVSGHAGPEHRRASRAAGFAHHVTKPVVFADLLARLDELRN